MTKPDESPRMSNDNVAGGRGYALVLQTLLAPVDQIRCAEEAEAFVALLEQPRIAQLLPEPFDSRRREAIRTLKARYWRPRVVATNNRP